MPDSNKLELVVGVDVNKANASIKSILLKSGPYSYGPARADWYVVNWSQELGVLVQRFDPQLFPKKGACAYATTQGPSIGADQLIL